jgi:hypothetical protein
MQLHPFVIRSLEFYATRRTEQTVAFLCRKAAQTGFFRSMLLEPLSGVSGTYIMEMGAVCRILKRAKRRALDALGGADQGGYVTNHVTNRLSGGIANRQVIEKYGRPVRARTADLHRVKVAL